MTARMPRQVKAPMTPTPSFTPVHSRLLQRKGACGNHAIAGGECAECKKNRATLQSKAIHQSASGAIHSASRIPVLQPKLTVGASNDPLEMEADRIADQVLAAPMHSQVKTVPPSIQRYAGQTSERMDTAPASVDRVLASLGRPLEPALQQDMEQRFGHDFSRVRVHADEQASASARSVDARAYTFGSHVVFGTNQYAPGVSEGQRLLAHELAHVIQQGFAPMEPGPSHEMRQNPSGLGTNHGALLRQRTPPLLQRAPPAAPVTKVQVKDDQPHRAAEAVRDRVPVPTAADS